MFFSHSKVDSGRCWKNSGCKESGPGALFCLSVAMADLTSAMEKSEHRSWSADGVFHASFRCLLILKVNSLFGLLNFPLFIRLLAMSLALTGACEVKGLTFPVSLFSLLHACLLECVKLIFSVSSIHFSLRRLSRWLRRAVAAS